MNIRVRKIISYRLIAAILLFLSIGLSSFVTYKVISLKPEKIVLDIIALSLTIAFAIAQIILIIHGKKKESHLLDIAFNTDNTANKLALVIVIIGSLLGIALDILAIVVLCTSADTIAIMCSMLIILSISTYLLMNCVIYFAFLILFRKRKLTLEDYAK